jgi:uridine kinase
VKLARAEVIQQLAVMISGLKRPHPVRVGIDGIDASGKSHLADELVDAIRNRGRNVIRVCLDCFHLPRETRHRQGRYSPKGYYEDSFNYPAILSNVLVPLGPGGHLRYRTASHDYHKDEAIEAPWQDAPADFILVFDGVFLKRPELAKYWDYHVFVDCSFEESLKRVLKRDAAQFGGESEVRKLYQERFFPGQRLYLEQTRPRETADAILDNNEFENPQLIVKQRSVQ